MGDKKSWWNKTDSIRRMTLLYCAISALGCGGLRTMPSNDDVSEIPDVTPEDAAAENKIDSNGEIVEDTTTPPVCGDGQRRYPEECDDGNTDSGDGCSADCSSVESGWICPVPGDLCLPLVVCGDRRRDESEACDDGNTDSGDGCSADCSSVESGWICPIAGAACRAAACGDGIIAGNEECEDDDGPNPESWDGCDSNCHLEDGFVCEIPGNPCRPTTCGDGLIEGSEQCDDVNNDMGDGCDPLCHREPRCTDGVCEGVCGDGVRLPQEECDDGNGRAGDGCSATCTREEGFVCQDEEEEGPLRIAIPIVYRDFLGRDLPGGHPDFQYVIGDDRGIVATTLGTDGKPVYASATTTPTTNGREAFDQWYRDTSGVNLTVVDRLTLDRTEPGTFVFDSANFFPLDGRGWVAAGREPTRTNGHNFHFTSEVRYWFEYQGGETLSFRGDDDVWVFINRALAIDIGGVHGAESDSITLDDAAAARFNLRAGGIYEAVVFQAERHTTQSSYRLTFRGFQAPRSRCEYICGDAIVTRFEVCDDGLNDGSYCSCMPDCLAFAPCCGDGVVQPEFGEECDDRNVFPGDGCDESCQEETIG